MMSEFTTKCASRLLLCLALAWPAASLLALESDRQQPLEVDADATEGTLGDGISTLSGNVEIRQGTLLIQADVARVEKVEGRVRRLILTGAPVRLQQEIEEQGLVSAKARRVEYEVASGLVTLTGDADVVHPQYQISGEVLRYDLNVQHFEGAGTEEDGRIRIRLDPEVIEGRREALPEPGPAVEEEEPAGSGSEGF